MAVATAAALADPVEEASAERQFCALSRRLDGDMRRAGDDKGRLVKAYQNFLDDDAAALAARTPPEGGFDNARPFVRTVERAVRGAANGNSLASVFEGVAYSLTYVAQDCAAPPSAMSPQAHAEGTLADHFSVCTKHNECVDAILVYFPTSERIDVASLRMPCDYCHPLEFNPDP